MPRLGFELTTPVFVLAKTVCVSDRADSVNCIDQLDVTILRDIAPYIS
jgi:hypothetical protein